MSPLPNSGPRAGRRLTMATLALTGAALAQNRHQGALREYANQKVAPYLKKALKDMCDVDAEYPLQWLGEHLINQSFLYENNPDTTGIKERFFYNFDPEPLSGGGANSSVPTAAAAATTTTTTTGAVAAATSDNILTATIVNISTADTQLLGAEARDSVPQQPLYNGEQHAVDGQMVGTEEGYDVSEQMDLGHEHNSRDQANTNMLNGIAEAERDEVVAEHGEGVGEGVMDTEMAGTT